MFKFNALKYNLFGKCRTKTLKLKPQKRDRCLDLVSAFTKIYCGQKSTFSLIQNVY
jgi:hypothetical protein